MRVPSPQASRAKLATPSEHKRPLRGRGAADTPARVHHCAMARSQRQQPDAQQQPHTQQGCRVERGRRHLWAGASGARVVNSRLPALSVAPKHRLRRRQSSEKKKLSSQPKRCSGEFTSQTSPAPIANSHCQIVNRAKGQNSPAPPRAHLAAWRWPCRSSSSSCARRATFADMERGHTAAAVTKTAPRSRMAPDRSARAHGHFLIWRVRRRPPHRHLPHVSRASASAPWHRARRALCLAS